MQTYSSLFEHELRKLIAEEIEKARDKLEINTYEDVGQFKYVMGQISAYKMLLSDLMQLAAENAEQRNR